MAITAHANISVHNPVFDETLCGPARILTYPEAASQSFKKGEFVVLSSGKVAIATATIDGFTSMWGIAMADASGVTNKAIDVRLIDTETYLIMSLADLSAVDTGDYAAPAVANVGVQYGITKEIADNNKWVVNINAASTTDVVEVVAQLSARLQDLTDPTASVYGGKVIVRPLINALTTHIQYVAP